ncbi:hypothetical protein M758_UG268900 [Ceratodon purpureus]|nr:hypothetical protein M758_UG268900 [Ceratodon purpureus]
MCLNCKVHEEISYGIEIVHFRVNFFAIFSVYGLCAAAVVKSLVTLSDFQDHHGLLFGFKFPRPHAFSCHFDIPVPGVDKRVAHLCHGLSLSNFPSSPQVLRFVSNNRRQ